MKKVNSVANLANPSDESVYSEETMKSQDDQTVVKKQTNDRFRSLKE